MGHLYRLMKCNKCTGKSPCTATIHRISKSSTGGVITSKRRVRMPQSQMDNILDERVPSRIPAGCHQTTVKRLYVWNSSFSGEGASRPRVVVEFLRNAFVHAFIMKICEMSISQGNQIRTSLGYQALPGSALLDPSQQLSSAL